MNQSPSLTLTRKCGGKWPTGSTLREPYWGEEGKGAATLILLSWWEGVSTLREPYWGEDLIGVKRGGERGGAATLIVLSWREGLKGEGG